MEKRKERCPFSKGFSVCRHRFHEVSEDQFVPFVAVKRESRVLFGRSKPLGWRGGGWRSQQAQKIRFGRFRYCCCRMVLSRALRMVVYLAGVDFNVIYGL